MLDRFIDLVAKINNIEYEKSIDDNGVITIFPINANHQRKSAVRSIFTTGILIQKQYARKYKVNMEKYHE